MDENPPSLLKSVKSLLGTGDYWRKGVKMGLFLFIIFFCISIITMPFSIFYIIWNAIPASILYHFVKVFGIPLTNNHGDFISYKTITCLGYLLLSWLFILIGGLIGTFIDYSKKVFRREHVIIIFISLLIIGLYLYVAYSNTLSSCIFTTNRGASALDDCHLRFAEHQSEPFSPTVCSRMTYDLQRCYTILAVISKDMSYCEYGDASCADEVNQARRVSRT